MKKLIYIVLIVAFAWVIKLSYDFFQLSRQLADIQETSHKYEQKIAALNDQLVAVQRQNDPKDTQKNQPTPKVQMDVKPVGISPTVLIKQRLELIQFAIQQQQFVYALEQLLKLNESIHQYELADAVKQSLHQAIEKDSQTIQQFVLAKHTQKEQLDQVLQQIDQQIQAAVQNMQLQPAQQKSEYFWQKWFRVDMVQSPNADLVNRRLILREVQLRVLLAQHALVQGENIDYRNALNVVVNELNLLPDAASQKIKQQILKIKDIQLLQEPKLSSAAVVE